VSALSTGAQLAAAAATTFAASVTAWMAVETRKVAKKTGEVAEATLAEVEATKAEVEVSNAVASATRDQAAATRDQAVATGEMVASAKDQAIATAAMVAETRRAQDLQWRPILSATERSRTGDASRVELVLKDVGGGPAIAGRYLRKGTQAWCMSDPVDIAAASASDPLIASQQDGRPNSDYFAAPVYSAGSGAEPVIVLFCRDILGKRYRFVFAQREGQPIHAFPSEVWEPGTSLAPPWATPGELWPL
jgi:hypothetical protein